MNEHQITQLCFQALLLGNAIFWTLAYINRVATFLIRGYKNLDAEITVRQMLYMTISWTVFFWLMKV